jgi:Delta3-Delta2-enoyl-CoA isomerase
VRSDSILAMIELDWHGDIAVLTMNAGENRWNAVTVAELATALDEIDAREGSVGLVVTGTGKFFSNGLDLDWIMADPNATGDFFEVLFRSLARILRFAGPTVAAVNGHAFGAGAMLCTVCDHAVMRADRGYWCMPEADLGLPVDPRIYALLATRLPKRTLTEAINTGRRWSGPDAVAAGFVDRTAPEAEVVPLAVEHARSLADKDRGVIAVHKRLLHHEALEILDPGGPNRPAAVTLD